jgi:phosphoglycolate phosphatase-like HAD superfamily hydrolase
VSIDHYQAFVFDCDGVLLDSNSVKSQAFYQAALPYGEQYALNLLEYHQEHGGISRFKKFDYFLEKIIPAGKQGPDKTALLDAFATATFNGLLSCDSSRYLQPLKQKTEGKPWYIVSGGAQEELRTVFNTRGLDTLFDGGIFGSPSTKDEILTRLIAEGLPQPALFLGDSRYDHIAADNASLDFMFVSSWSEFNDWPRYCKQCDITVIETLEPLCG